MLVYSISFLAIFLQRKEYDTTGKVLKTVEEEFVDAFGGGKDNPKRTETFIFIDFKPGRLKYNSWFLNFALFISPFCFQVPTVTKCVLPRLEPQPTSLSSSFCVRLPPLKATPLDLKLG